MAKVLICDKVQNSKDVLSSYIQNIEGIELFCAQDELSQINDISEIDLIIFDVNSQDAETVLCEIKKIKNKKPSIKIIATSYDINSELVVRVLKEGVDDFLLKPLLQNVLEATIKKVLSKNEKNTNLATITLFSNKGGVGKTSCAINLAYEIEQITNEKVCLLDLSFNQEDIATFLNVESKFDLDYIISNIESADENLLLSLMNRYKNTNLYILSYPKTINTNRKYTPQNVTKIINSLKNIFSYIVIDTTNTIDETTVSILNNSNLILLLATMNLTAIRNCQKCYELFDKIGYNSDKIKLVINRYIENYEITTKEIEKTIGKEVFFKIPNNYLTLTDAINYANMVSDMHPQSNIAKAYKNLADEILKTDFLSLNEDFKKPFNHGVFNLLRRMGE